MNKKYYPFLLVAVLLIALLVVRKLIPTAESTRTTRKSTTTGKIDRNRGFDRRISYIKYSNHAKCRMKCRHITQAEVEDIMQEGKINYKKSELKNVRCPRYALEGITDDNQRVRIIFAQCDESTTVVTVIDLETEYECSCPGDD